MSLSKPIFYVVPVCPFSQRVQIMLALRDQSDAIEIREVDITKPRSPELLQKTGGSTSLPVLELPDGTILKESLVILRFLDESLEGKMLRRSDPLEHSIENMLTTMYEGPFTASGYLYIMNQDAERKHEFHEKILSIYKGLDNFLVKHNPNGTWLFDDFGLAEAVFTPLFKRFWFLEYYEDFELPYSDEYTRVKKWRDACMIHPSTNQVSKEEIVKTYYDYAHGLGNGRLGPGRKLSTAVFHPHWKDRPWPPRDKYSGRICSDEELGLSSGVEEHLNQ